ncbi:MAG: hypothetical protein JXA42_20545, partial [Anaerolineales bacterium]|nr:hypothetical protein [Anaerolineales bacterium]
LELYVIRPSTLCKILIYFKQQPFQSNLSHRTTLFWFGMYTIIWLVSGIGLFIIIQLFQNLPISSLPIVISTWILSSLISYITLFSPSGFGVKELSLTLLLGLFLSEPLPLITALAIRVVWTIYDMLIGVAVQVL